VGVGGRWMDNFEANDQDNERGFRRRVPARELKEDSLILLKDAALVLMEEKGVWGPNEPTL